MNISVFPCFNDCKDHPAKRQFSVSFGATSTSDFTVSLMSELFYLFEGAIGSDCSKLGIKVADSTSTPGSGDSYGESRFDLFSSFQNSKTSPLPTPFFKNDTPHLKGTAIQSSESPELHSFAIQESKFT